MRVEAKIHPGLALTLEGVFVHLGLKKLWSWAFHRQLHVPPAMVDVVHEAHAAPGENLENLVPLQNDVSHLPNLRDVSFRVLCRRLPA
jgi:hypothetical protein